MTTKITTARSNAEFDVCDRRNEHLKQDLLQNGYFAFTPESDEDRKEQRLHGIQAVLKFWTLRELACALPVEAHPRLWDAEKVFDALYSVALYRRHLCEYGSTGAWRPMDENWIVPLWTRCKISYRLREEPARRLKMEERREASGPVVVSC